MKSKKIYILLFSLLIFFILKKISIKNIIESFYYKNNSYNKNIDLNIYMDFYGVQYIKDLINRGYKIQNAKSFLNKKVSYNKNNNKTIIIGDGEINYNDMENIYKHCYIGLRLTPHDGNANQVIELGLMGIKTVYNGGGPSSLPYKSLNDIINHIENEKNTIGITDSILSKKIYKFCKFDKSLFNLNKYFSNSVNTKFNQIYISKSLNFFRDKVLSINENLKLYNNPNKPTIFFGVYKKEDLDTILNHKSYGLIIFGGSDTLSSNKINKKLSILSELNPNQFAFIAISKYIEDDLKLYDIKYHKHLFYFGEKMLKPIKKGNCIYVYLRKNP